jgi:phospholipase C
VANESLRRPGWWRHHHRDESAPRGLRDLKHLVVIYLENHSFDNLYGSYPGAEGLESDSAQIPQLDATTGMVFDTLPQMDPNVPTGLPNVPFDITKYVPANQKTIDLVHRFYQEQQQIAGGAMDHFVTVSDAKGLSFGYYPTESLPLYQKIKSIPDEVTLCDHFFHAAFGGSFLNHMWLIAAQTPVFKDAPDSMVAKLDEDGTLMTDGPVTPDGYVVNTSYTVNAPHPATTATENLVPNQTFATIGDRLSDKDVSWAWYSGGWNDALAGNPDMLFQFHHQPFAFFENFKDGSLEGRDRFHGCREERQAAGGVVRQAARCEQRAPGLCRSRDRRVARGRSDRRAAKL